MQTLTPAAATRAETVPEARRERAHGLGLAPWITLSAGGAQDQGTQAPNPEMTICSVATA